MSLNSLNNLQPGQVVVYFTGLSAALSCPAEIRNTANLLHIEDKAFLLQRRIYDGKFEYLAIGKKAPPDMKVVFENRERAISLAKWRNK